MLYAQIWFTLPEFKRGGPGAAPQDPTMIHPVLILLYSLQMLENIIKTETVIRCYPPPPKRLSSNDHLKDGLCSIPYETKTDLVLF